MYFVVFFVTSDYVAHYREGMLRYWSLVGPIDAVDRRFQVLFLGGGLGKKVPRFIDRAIFLKQNSVTLFSF